MPPIPISRVDLQLFGRAAAASSCRERYQRGGAGDRESDGAASKLTRQLLTFARRDQGTGLGLSTVFGIVKQADGNVWIESGAETGTTIVILLPAAEEAGA